MMKRLVLLLLTCVSLAFAQTANVAQSEAPEVVVNHASSDIFPQSWLTEEINAKAELLPVDEQQRARDIADKALAKYPPDVLKANLKRIYVVKRLSYSGVDAGGTNSRDAVYVIVRQQVSDVQSEEIIHAEFSSILLRNFPTYLDTVAWQKINDPDFKYRGNGVEAIKSQQASEHSSDVLLEAGFLNEYAKASIEEDFNSFTERLLVGDAQLWETCEKYPKIKAKTDLVMSFYEKLNPKLTKEFFISLRQPVK